MIVVDATVATKWYLVEPGSDRAEALAASGEEFCEPAILRLEVLSAISQRYRTGGIAAADAESLLVQWLEDLESRVVTLWPEDADLESALRLSLRIRHAAVDCLYLACAMRIGAALITADDTLLRRARPVHAAVRML